MSSEAAFLSEIREHPDDLAAHLVFADWLEEIGDPARAEFIRTECQAAALPEWDPARFEHEERARDLLAEHRTRWLAHLPGWARSEELSFRRGILSSATFTAAAFLRHGDRLARLIPLTHLKLFTFERVAELARLGATRLLTDLELDLGSGLVAPQRLFFEHFESHRLRRLSLRRPWLDRGDPEVVADWPGLAGLTSLDIGLTNCEAILRSLHLGRLERLALDGDLTPQAARSLARSERLLGLREAILSRTSSADSVRALAEAEWPALEQFSLVRGAQDTDGLQDLLASRWASGLRSLELIDGPESGTARTLARYQPDKLAHLALPLPQVTPHEIVELAGADCLTNLTSLRLPLRSVTDDGAVAIARSSRLGRLVRLDVSASPLGEVGLTALIESERLSSLRELRINRLGGSQRP